MTRCSIHGCERSVCARNWCKLHYQRWRNHGDPNWAPATQLERFWERVEMEGPLPSFRPELGRCWVWKATPNIAGYGQFSYRGRSTTAHRVAYEMFVGPIPNGLHVDHLCRVRSCVNPEHLEAVTRAENQRRGLRGDLLTRCKWGHPFDEENTYRRPSGVGQRYCRTCLEDNRKEPK